MGKKDFFKQANIVLELAAKDIKLKYNNTTFGYLWMLINPLIMLFSLYVVFSLVIKLELPYYQIFLLLGIIVWNFFSEATTNSLNSMRNSLTLLKKIKVPPYLIIISSNVSSLVGLASNLFILLIMMSLSNIGIFTPIRILGIFYLFLLFLISISFSIIISTIYLHFKDVKHIWNFLLFIGFWVSPIIYPETYIPEPLLSIYMTNPIARVISHLRNAVIYNYVDSGYQIMITFTLVSILFIFSAWIYNNYSYKIYDLL